MAKGDAQLLREIRSFILATPARGGDAEKLAFIGILRERIITGLNVIPCPKCGHPIDIREAGTHIRHGYREPHIKPYLPGSWLAERDAELPQ